MVVMFGGNVSENDAPVKGVAFGFVNVNVMVEVPFVCMVAGENDLVIVGRPNTIKFAVPAAPPTTLVWVLVGAVVVLT